MAILTIDDFVGKFSIVTNGYKEASLTSYIDRYESVYLAEMLGKELYDLFIADIEQVIPQAIYLKLKNPFIEQPNCKVLISKGVKDMLLGFIYFQWNNDEKVQQTINSGTRIKNENGTIPANDYGALFDRWNEAVDTYKAIQEYCLLNSTDYQTFKGVRKSHKYLTW